VVTGPVIAQPPVYAPPTAPPKKSKAGLVVAIVAAVLLAAGAGFVLTSGGGGGGTATDATTTTSADPVQTTTASSADVTTTTLGFADPATRQAFVSNCVTSQSGSSLSSGDVQTFCTCSYDAIAANISFDRFQEADAEARDTGQFPEDVRQAIQPCIDALPG
jgi:hypothetical protein